MIEFYNLPVNEKAHEAIVKEMVAVGYEPKEAERLADAATSVTLSFVRSLDAMIKVETDDELDQTVIQQLVLHQVMGIFRESMKLNTIGQFLKILGRL